ncbi:MAG: uroporphyrinogen-III C-methyltransferase [Formosimonas sp.]
MNTITFVGAGPGAADLITVRGQRALQRAQVVLFDALLDEGLLTYCAPDVILVDVGKRCSKTTAKPQDDINALLVAYGTQYAHTVRLKGGDPSIFGRLDEEISAAQQAGLAVEVVPGVTAALAAAAAAQTPLTRRGVTRSIRFLTATVGTAQPLNTWDAALDPTETMVFYMAGKQLREIGLRLLAGGFAAHTPALIVRGASWSNQDCQRLMLADLPDWALSASDAPCLLMVGLALS